jgi:hypothetical protein
MRPQMQHSHHAHAHPRSSAKSPSAPPRASISISIFTPPQAAVLRQALPSRPLASPVFLTPCATPMAIFVTLSDIGA